MSTSDVRNIDSLQRLRGGLLLLADNWEKALQEIRISLHRAEQYFTQDVPRYWRHQTEQAERDLTESLDNLQQKQSAARAGDRVSAVEAQQRVNRAKARLSLCREKQRAAKSLAIEVRHQCEEMLGPLADMAEHSDNWLPAAADRLQALLEMLLRYTDASSLPQTPEPQHPPNDPTELQPPRNP